MKLILNDNTELECVVVNGNSRYFQNAQRDSLEFIFKKGDYDFNKLDEYFSDKNKTKKITIVDDTNSQFVHEDYVLRISLTLSPVVVTTATSDNPEVTEERISIIMGQQNYIEKMLSQLLNK